VVNISGGNVGGRFDAESGSLVNISGGAFDGRRFDALSGSVVNISGGTFGEGFKALSGSQVNLVGSNFVLDGDPLNSLVVGEAFTIVDRNVTLTGLLADGSAFSFDLMPSDFDNSDVNSFDSNATLTVTLDSEVLLGDCNLDGVVDFLDISPFISILSTGGFLGQADCNQDGTVNFLDISSFIEILSAS